MHRRILLLLAAIVLLAAACGNETAAETPHTAPTTADLQAEAGSPSAAAPSTAVPSNRSPSADVLLAGVDRTEAAPHRFEAYLEMTMSLGGMAIDAAPDDPVLSGATDGTATTTTMDLGAIVESLFAGMPGGDMFDLSELFGDPDDLTFETVTAANELYLRAPFLASIGALDPALSNEPGFDALAALGEGWGRVDLDRVDGDVSASDLAALSGASVADVAALMDLLRTTSEVSELGSDTRRGASVNGYRATTTIGALLEATGQGGPASGAMLPSLGDVDAELATAAVGIDVWVDDVGRIRQIAFALDLTPPADAAAGEQMSIAMTIDFFGYDADVMVQVPTDAVDITDVFAQLSATTA